MLILFCLGARWSTCIESGKPMSTAVAKSPLLELHIDDNIAIARSRLGEGQAIELGNGRSLVARSAIPAGHKVASREIASGEAVRKFGQIIGIATCDIGPGEWVHSHNLVAGDLHIDPAIGTRIPPEPSTVTGRVFEGYRRSNGRAGTRNYLAIVTMVNCSATTAQRVVAGIGTEILAEYPNVDGVIALTHKGGCALQYGGEDHRQLARTLAGFARHANVGAYLLLGLGCESAPASFLEENYGLVQLGGEKPRIPTRPVLTIQEVGGVRKTTEKAIGACRELLIEANAARRESIPVSELVLALECGGSDGYSGITANPALGVAADLLVAHGGTAILSETPEVYGAEHLLTRRAVSREVGEALLERIRWWEGYTKFFGVEIDNNPSPGNKAGGLTTIYEKSLGAVAKGGSTALRGVYRYAESVTERGFVFMDTPGYDPASVTGMVAGGANLVAFTTGRGSCFGCKPVPSLKICTNTPTYERMIDDMDIDAGTILDGESVQSVGQRIFEALIATASGEPTKSEQQGIGDEEFCPWSIGPVL